MNMVPILMNRVNCFSFRTTALRTQHFLFQCKKLATISPKMQHAPKDYFSGVTICRS
uniref:Uncharacterized protein n=1 Tax=Arundo donax TaxID=35708 RepID=A0A0A9CRM9_ARUDO